MKWKRMGAYYSQSDQDYVVSASRYGNRGWRYTVYGPVDPGWRERRTVEYAIGEHVPRAREIIDAVSDHELARQACENHWTDNQARERTAAERKAPG